MFTKCHNIMQYLKQQVGLSEIGSKLKYYSK